MKAKVLAVDDDPQMVSLLERHLAEAGWNVTSATSGTDALAAIAREEFDVILSDLIMDDVDGMAVLREAQRIQPRARVILMTAFGSIENAIDAMRKGAYDYLTKPFRLAEVTLAAQRALDDRRLRDENRRLQAEVEQRYGLDKLMGRSKAVQAVVAQIRVVAGSDASVLLIGESGTGKELAARAIHWNSARRDAAFVAVNCAAIPETLLESELFGHEKGAFTGADRKRRGLFAQAQGGTLFLDEVAEMPPALQAKLLRALQDKAIRPVGGSDEIQLDLRVIAASNRDLPALVRDGRFRDDLYYRLAVIPIRLPSLRERPGDIPLLAQHFLERAAAALGKRIEGMTEEAMRWLLDHRWPGNVRELENVVERAVTLARGPRVELTDLRTEFAASEAAGPAFRPTLAKLEQQYIQRVLEETGGDKTAASRILGVSVRTLQRRARRP